MENWPRELEGVVSEVAQQLGVNSLYCEAEISGLGGARTFRARTDAKMGIGKRLVLKIGKPELINDELRRYREAQIHFGTHPSLQYFSEVGEPPSWLAMSVALDGLGETLRRRFDTLSDEEIDTVIDRLFIKGIRLYERNEFNRARSAFNQYAVHPSLVPKLREIGDGPYTLVDWWKDAAANDEPRSTEAYIHGDLHCGNVLVAGKGESIQISLIDFGLSGMGHAYRDLAKLERDLCLFVASAKDDSVSKRLSEIDSLLEEGPRSTSSAIDPNDPNVERAARAIRQIRNLAQGLSRVANGARWQHEYDVALIAQFMFAAGNRSISEAKRLAAIDRAYALRDRLIACSPNLEPNPDAERELKQEDQTWKVAYSLLRLDQLPRGGWSRSLPQWMELIWEGEHGTVFRSPAMKDDGGDDSAGYAVHLLSQFAGWVHGDRLNPSDAIRDALHLCAQAFQERVRHGALDEGATTRGEPPPIKVRHTLVGLLAHLNCERMVIPGFDAGVDSEVVDYLLKVIPTWTKDKSHLFGMYASAVALWRVLGELPCDSLPGKSSSLRTCLDAHLPEMATLLRNVHYKPKPEKTYTGHLVHEQILASFFIPYYDLWRMERSNALMFLPLLLDESGSRFTRQDDLPHAVKQRIVTSLRHLMNEVEQDTTDSSKGLIRYHNSVGRTQAPRDWGLSAELLRLLDMPAIQALLQDAGVEETALNQRRSILRRSLRETLANYGKYHPVFRFTHGLSVGAYLSEQVARRISPRQMTVLDEQIRVAGEQACSEQALHRLAQCILTGEFVTDRNDNDKEDESSIEANEANEAKMLTELFVRTLAAGDHASGEHWQEGSYRDTIAYFDRPAARVNPATRSGIHDTLFLRLLHVFGPSKERGCLALDLGCGDGSTAKWLVNKHFHVTLVDGSKEMLRRAKETLRNVGPGKAEFVEGDVRNIGNDLTKGPFDLVIANALFVHIAPEEAAELISKIYKVLNPGGHFFFNVKLRDHTLVSLDGRYFAYYPDIIAPRSMLRGAGFDLDEVALRDNHRTCYGVPKDIHWANFYCSKPK